MRFFNLSILSATILLLCRHVTAKAVFAHFMVSNAANFSTSDWATEMRLAKAAHVDAFALNIAYDQNNDPQLANAFEAAGSSGFQCFFSFDYAGNGPWPETDVLTLLYQYANNGAYYHYNNQPFVSTFEGPGNAQDWVDIKSKTSCFFMPDWSSAGAKDALQLAGGVADGLFSWAAWPWSNQDMNTYVDASYRQYLGDKPYMMAVSPWFYTNLPGYDKNWLWKGDNLWFDRWQEVLTVQPEFVEIVTWNDFGESHYIGPLHDNAFALFVTGAAPFNFAANMPHDGWRDLMPFMVDMYTQGSATVSQEGLVVHYRLQPKDACSDGDTTGNTATQLQLEFQPADVMEDKVYFNALLASDADVSVTIGGSSRTASWSLKPQSGVGIYRGSAALNGATGQVVVTVSRNGFGIMTMVGQAITNTCAEGGLANWNAWVGSARSSAGVSATASINGAKCIKGTGAGNFAGLCDFGCYYGYCPLSACLCLSLGTPAPLPESQNVMGYPIAGEDASYSGLCSFDCNYGYCPSGACSTTEQPLTVPTVSDFAPPACNGGMGPGGFEGLCSYSCNYGMCPINVCTCTSQGALNVPPSSDGSTATSNIGEDYGLCTFTCSRGYCPDVCSTQKDVQLAQTSSTSQLEFIDCTKTEIATIKAAYTNGIKDLAGALGNPPKIDFENDPDVQEYFGTRANGRTQFIEAKIRANLNRLADPMKYNDIPFPVQCRPQANEYFNGNCTYRGNRQLLNGEMPAAYVINNDNLKFPAINICPSFFDLDTQESREQDVGNGGYGTTMGGAIFPVDSTQTFYATQSASFLHELLHIPYAMKRPGVGTVQVSYGIAKPRCIDHAIKGYIGRVYNPYRAKFLASLKGNGAELAYKNNDNYIYFLTAKYMANMYGSRPTYPQRGWYSAGDNGRHLRRDDANDTMEHFDDPSNIDQPEMVSPVNELPDDQILVGDEPQAPLPGPVCYGQPSTPAFTRQLASDSINQYCTLLLQRNTTFSCQSPYAPIGFGPDDRSFSLWPTIQWDEGSCIGAGPVYDYDDCMTYLYMALDGCNTDTTDYKHGGHIQVECLIYDLQAIAGMDETPPLGFDATKPNCVEPFDFEAFETSF